MADPAIDGRSTSTGTANGSDGDSPRPADRRKQIELLLAMRRHLHVAHHIPGRLRLRADAGLLELANQWRGPHMSLDEAIRRIEGIRDVRVNAAAATAVIEYEPESLPPEAWQQLLDGNDAEALDILEARLSVLDQGYSAADPAASAFG